MAKTALICIVGTVVGGVIELRGHNAVVRPLGVVVKWLKLYKKRKRFKQNLAHFEIAKASLSLLSLSKTRRYCRSSEIYDTRVLKNT